MKKPYLKESFVSEAECAVLIALIQRYANREPNLQAMFCSEKRTEVAVSFLYDHGVRDELELLSNITLRSQAEVEAQFSLERQIYPEFTMLQGNYLGDGHIRHADNCRYDEPTNMWVPNHTPQRVITCIIYLNRHGTDFLGGELIFPELDLSLAPKQGLFVAFPSDEKFEHEVPAVTLGARYSYLIWFTDDPAFAEGPLQI